MAEKLLSYDDSEEEDYIDMEVSSHRSLFFKTISSPSNQREFEFQMFSSSSERDTTTSPADELFYKGKLLPLHLPPRLQMVEKLLQDKNKDSYDEFFSTPLATNSNTTPTSNTPFESCNISPADSCHVSRELNPEEYFLEGSTEANEWVRENPKKSWTRKLKLTKQSSLGSKLKASRDYLKSLFNKSGCSDESSARGVEERAIPKAKECTKTTTFGQIHRDTSEIRTTTAMKSFNKENFVKDSGGGHHRRSFSGAIKRFSTTKSSSSLFQSGSTSSSSSSNSNSFNELQLHQRSINRVSEIENPIQSAIAHCKSSQQQLHSRKTVSDMGFCSLAASRIVCEDQERQLICRG